MEVCQFCLVLRAPLNQTSSVGCSELDQPSSLVLCIVHSSMTAHVSLSYMTHAPKMIVHLLLIIVTCAFIPTNQSSTKEWAHCRRVAPRPPSPLSLYFAIHGMRLIYRRTPDRRFVMCGGKAKLAWVRAGWLDSSPHLVTRLRLSGGPGMA
jgi:hypothetical protein